MAADRQQQLELKINCLIGRKIKNIKLKKRKNAKKYK